MNLQFGFINILIVFWRFLSVYFVAPVIPPFIIISIVIQVQPLVV